MTIRGRPAPVRQQWTPLEEGHYYLRLMKPKETVGQLCLRLHPRHGFTENFRRQKSKRIAPKIRLAREEARYIAKHGVVQRCHFCGCTEEDCTRCVERTGSPCAWHDSKTCTACVDDARAHFQE